MILQLNPAIPVTTPKGPGLAHFMIDYGIESHIYWVVFLDKNGECWTYANPEIRAHKNITQGRDHVFPFYKPEDVSIKEKPPENCAVSEDAWIDSQEKEPSRHLQRILVLGETCGQPHVAYYHNDDWCHIESCFSEGSHTIGQSFKFRWWQPLDHAHL